MGLVEASLLTVIGDVEAVDVVKLDGMLIIEDFKFVETVGLDALVVAEVIVVEVLTVSVAGAVEVALAVDSVEVEFTVKVVEVVASMVGV
jgi:hypothetical protein